MPGSGSRCATRPPGSDPCDPIGGSSAAREQRTTGSPVDLSPERPGTPADWYRREGEDIRPVAASRDGRHPLSAAGRRSASGRRMRRRSSSPARSTTGPATGRRSHPDGDGSTGTWSADVPGVAPGAEYRFTIRTGKGDLSRWTRTRGTSPTRSGNGIVYDPAAFDWGDDDFHTPTWDDLVIYEMHVGTFAATDDRGGTFDAARRRLPYLERPRRVGRPGHAAVRVRGRHLVGLQPGPPVRDRVRATAARTRSSASSATPMRTGSP